MSSKKGGGGKGGKGGGGAAAAPTPSSSSASGERTIKQVIKMTIPAGQASPSPPVGPRVGQLGLPIMPFCKDFNEQSKHFADGIPLSCKLVAYDDRSYKLRVFGPTMSYYVKACAGLDKGAMAPGKEVAGHIPLKMVYEIAKLQKEKDPRMKHYSMKALCRMVLGAARSMGIFARR